MVSYETSVYVLAGFLLAYGLLFLWISMNDTGGERKGIGSFVNPGLYFALFALLYIALSHFTLFVGMGATLDYGNVAPCENVVANTTEAPAGVISYEYKDSCANITTPASVETLFTLFSWLLYIDLLAMALGMMLLFARWISRW